MKSFVFPRKLCSFIQGDTNSCSSIAVTCCQTNMILHVRVVLLGEEIVPAGTCEIPIPGSTSDTGIVISGLTCSPSGVFSFIGESSMLTSQHPGNRVADSRGIWATYQLLSLNSSLVSTPISENLHLQRLAILTTQKPSREGISLVSLGTSLVLLAAVVRGTEELSLQIWDLAYGVLLTAQAMPIPSAIPFPHLSLSVTNEGQVLLTVSPSSSFEKSITPKRSTIHIVPVDARLKSSIAAALGKTALTAEWLMPKESDHRKTKEDDKSTKIISNIQASLRKNNAQKAEQAFLEWVNSHSVRKPYMYTIRSLMPRTVERGRSRT